MIQGVSLDCLFAREFDTRITPLAEKPLCQKTLSGKGGSDPLKGKSPKIFQKKRTIKGLKLAFFGQK